MVTARFQGVVRRLRQTALCESSLSDGELLDRYLSQRDETAFAAIVRRHGPMVLGVCRRVLADAHDADDAFQATFLVLVKKANSILPRERVGPWLYGVAYRTSLKAKTMNSRRRAKQKTLEDVPSPPASTDTDWLALLDQEIARLPDKYRLPIVLCDLEGKTRKQAARQLGWPEGTVSTRLQHGRALVYKRLTRRGLTLSAGAMTLAWAQAVSAAAVPGPLVTSTVETASAFAVGKAAGVIPLKIAALTQGVLHAMVLHQVKNATAMLLLVGVLGLGLGGLSGSLRTATAQPPASAQPAPAALPTPKTAATVQRSSLEKNDGRLPTGPAPVQALVSFDKDKVVVKTNQPYYLPRSVVDGLGRSITFYEAVFALQSNRYDPATVEVYDTKRRKLDNKDMAKWLKQEIAALVLAGTRDVDPLHLRLIKEGTLIFVLPAQVMSPPTMPVYQAAPAIPEGWPQVPLAVPNLPRTTPPLAPAPRIENPPVAPSQVLPPQPKPPQPTPTQPTSPATIEQAERELAIAEFYLKAGHPGSAAFYYEMIGRRYPATSYAQRAAQLLKELPRQELAPPAAVGLPPVRIGEIIIVGNRGVPDTVILENLPLYPGQVLKHSDVRVAEDCLARLDAFVNASAVVKLRPMVSVVESRRDPRFKDILVTVQESLRLDVMAEMKKLQGTWTVVSMAHDKVEKLTPNGPEIVISGDQLISKSKQNVARSMYVLDLSATPKGIRLIPMDGAHGAQPSSGTYEVDGDTLKLKLRSGGISTDMTMFLKRKSTAASQVEPMPEPADPNTRTPQVRLDFPATGLNIVAAEIILLGGDRVKLTDATLIWQKEPRNAPQRIQAKQILLRMDGPVQQVADLGTRRIVSVDLSGAISFTQEDQR